MKVNLVWSGPHSYDDVRAMKGNTDYGLYQIYGTHPVYGANALLYIGRARDQTFGIRFTDHPKLGAPAELRWEDNGLQYRIHTGRVHLKESEPRPTKARLRTRLAMAEHLLISAHSPAWNAQHVGAPPKQPRYHDFHILNWGQHGVLLPEVSGSRITNDAVYSSLADDPMEWP